MSNKNELIKTIFSEKKKSYMSVEFGAAFIIAVFIVFGILPIFI